MSKRNSEIALNFFSESGITNIELFGLESLNIEDFKEQLCCWIDASIKEGLTAESKVLSLKKDGNYLFFHENCRKSS